MMNFILVHFSPPTWPFLCFIVMSGVDEFSLQFILFPRHELCGEFRVFFADSPISGSFNPVLLRRCFVVGPLQ